MFGIISNHCPSLAESGCAKGTVPASHTTFLAMADVIDQCHAGTQRKATARESLLAAAEHAMASFIPADFQVGPIKKWRLRLHLPDLLHELGFLPSCFTAERKHRSISALPTRLQKLLQKTTSYEKRLLQQILAAEITISQEPGLFPGAAVLVKPKAANSKQLGVISEYTSSTCRAAQVASSNRLAKRCQICKEDVVVFNHGGQIGVGQVWFHIALGNQRTTLVRIWNIADFHAAKHYAKCRVSNLSGFVPVEAMQYAILFHQDAIVLLPYQFYSKL